MNKGLTS